MPLPTAEEVTNLYLYGATSRPANLLDPALLQNRANYARPVDRTEFMTQGGGRFVDAGDFEFLGDFFSPLNSIPPGTYSKDDIFKMFGYRDPVTGVDLKSASYSFNQIYYGTGDADYAERVYHLGHHQLQGVR